MSTPLKLTTFENTTVDVVAEEIFTASHNLNKTIWISLPATERSNDVLIVIEQNGITKTFPLNRNINVLKSNNLLY